MMTKHSEKYISNSHLTIKQTNTKQTNMKEFNIGWRLIPNFLRPFRYRTDIRCNECGKLQKQPINWRFGTRMMCQYGCDNTIFIDGSGQCES